MAGPALSPVPRGGGDPPAATPVPATTRPPATRSVAPAPVRRAGGARPATRSVRTTDMASTARRSVNARMVRNRVVSKGWALASLESVSGVGRRRGGGGEDHLKLKCKLAGREGRLSWPEMLQPLLHNGCVMVSRSPGLPDHHVHLNPLRWAM